MTVDFANEIALWKYEGIYSVYSFLHDDKTIQELLTGDYFVYVNGSEGITGYVCFGHSGQIPIAQRNLYTNDMVDIGVGLRPDLCGEGRGFEFLTKAIDFVQHNKQVTALRLTVALFNQRAISVYKRAGFRCINIVKHALTNKEFLIMTNDKSIESPHYQYASKQKT